MAAGGQIIVDRNGSIFMRFDTNGTVIGQYTAMATWDSMLVLGRGTASRPDLCSADWDTVTEEGAISGNTSQPQTMTSAWRTKVIDFGLPDVEKQVRCVDIFYQDHPDWTDETITVKYRVDCAGSGAIPTWTTLGSITLGAGGTASVAYDYETAHYTIPEELLSAAGKTFQFQFEADGHFRINRVYIYYDILTKKY